MNLKRLFAKLFVPKGNYCYKHIRTIFDEKKGIKFVSRNCPYFRHIFDITGICVLTKDMVDDMCKTCGINEFTDKELERMRDWK